MLTLYRDDAPGAYIPEINGTVPSIVDLEPPVLDRRDMKLLLRYPEPRRTATWIRMSFVACDDYIASSGVLYRAYLFTLAPLVEEIEQKPHPSLMAPLLCPGKFSAILEKQIKGYEPYSVNGKTGRECRVITRGVRARTEALTFPSTNRKRNLRQLQYYQKKGDLIYPENNPDRRSTFSKWLAHDPLFMLPRETQSPLSIRTIADSAKSSSEVYYDGKGTEEAGFPGVSIKEKGASTKRAQAWEPKTAPGEATLVAQTQTHGLASVKVDLMSVGGFGSIVKNAKEHDDKKGDQTTTGGHNVNATAELAYTRAVERKGTEENEGRVIKPTGSFEMTLGAKKAAFKKLGNKKRALVVQLTHLAICTHDHTSDASGTTRYDHPEGAIEFIQRVEQLPSEVVFRTMHEWQLLRNARAKLKEAKASKVRDAAPAPVSPTFMELALRPRKACCDGD